MVDGVQTQANAVSGDLVLKNSVMAGMKNNFSVPASQTWAVSDEQTWYSNVLFKNALSADNSSLDVVAPFALTAPNFTLKSSSSLLANSYWDTSSGITPSSSSASNALTIYPNPAVSEVNVVLPAYDGVSTIQINDFTGKTLLSKTVKDSEHEKLDVTSLNQGIYLISVRQGNTSYNQKLIVK
ncbi:T9SS type A sorting domain-containing protein, partial [uncultured Dysgonomonas sp.]|uniref:T9SS type A sorting domain-containing protein n=1 Tax=uncultured Dysgonomonas sp. TaxID=206096 RepID=UPI00261E5DA6